MEAIELLLAAEVRKLALQLRRDRWSAFAAAADIRSDGGKHPHQFEQMKARWEQDHPIAHYVPDAIAQLHNVALQIMEILKKK